MKGKTFYLLIMALSMPAVLSMGHNPICGEASEAGLQREIAQSEVEAIWGASLQANPVADSATAGSMRAAEPFIWVNYGQEQDYTGYKRVQGGDHADGNKMYICRARRSNGVHPGKMYKNKCLVPWNGQENAFTGSFQVLLSNTGYQWADHFNLSPAQIKASAISGGRNYKEALYICRKQMKDGLHPGKYLLSSGLCYVSWGGKETTWTNGFQILTP